MFKKTVLCTILHSEAHMDLTINLITDECYLLNALVNSFPVINK